MCWDFGVPVTYGTNKKTYGGWVPEALLFDTPFQTLKLAGHTHVAAVMMVHTKKPAFKHGYNFIMDLDYFG